MSKIIPGNQKHPTSIRRRFRTLVELISPLIKKGQQLAHIFSNHEAEIPC